MLLSSLFFSHSFAAALFTLFNPPYSISCPFSLFFALTNSLPCIPSPFLSPSVLPPLSHPSLNPATPHTRLSEPLSSSTLRLWQSGRRRRSEAKPATLATCIIHVPCSLCGSRFSAGSSLGHMCLAKGLWKQGPTEELRRWEC